MEDDACGWVNVFNQIDSSDFLFTYMIPRRKYLQARFKIQNSYIRTQVA